MNSSIKTVSFSGSCAARSKNTFVSKRISTPFRLSDIHATFSVGCENKLQLSFYISTDPSESTSAKPSGISILRDYGHVDYVIGNNTKKELKHNLVQKEAGSYLKVFAVNDDYYPHKIDVQIFIEIE